MPKYLVKVRRNSEAERTGVRLGLVVLCTLGALLFLRPAVAAPNFRNAPLVFEPNVGQADPAVRFLARGPGYVLSLTDNGAVFALHPLGRQPRAQVRLLLAGTTGAVRLEALSPTGGASNYLRGRDPAQWHARVPHFAQIAARGVYPGIDLVYYGAHNALEFDFLLAPGADPERIRLHWEGVQSLRLDGGGDLVLATAGGELRQRRPRVFQQVNGRRVEIEGRYVLRGRRSVGFQLSAHDPARPLLIDPVLTFSTFLGGSGDDFAARLAVDAAGNAYIAGQTSSLDFPASPGAPDLSANGGDDVFVTKLNASGSAVVYSTFLGGAGTDSATGIAVDSAGNAYITGSTDSANFPTTGGAFDPSPNGSHDAFVVKLNATGTALMYSTLLGGAGSDAAHAIAVDSSGNAVVAGATLSAAFPTTAGAYDTSPNGAADAFVAKLNVSGSALVYATLLGGSGDDGAEDVALDAAGNAYLVGSTSSANFPATAGAYSATFNGGSFPSDVFVAKLNPTGAALLYATFLGSSGDEWGYKITVDSAANAYVTGMTWSGSFPTTAGAWDQSFNGVADAFVSKLNAAGSALLYSTFLGGSDSDIAYGLAVDASGSVWISGQTASADFPTTAAAVDPTFNGLTDAFVAKLSATGSALLYSSYVGGFGFDSAPGAALDAAGSVYVAGYTFPVNFPTTPGAYDTVWNGGFDAFLLKQSSAPEAVSVSPAAGAGSGQTFTFTFSSAGGWQTLGVVNVLMNFWLDGRNSCYLAYSQPDHVLYLVNDAGTALSPPLTLGSAGSVSNSQCTVYGTGSSAAGNGNILTLTLNMAFRTTYAGTKIIYLAARTIQEDNSGWQRLGVWHVPGAPPASPAVASMNPSRAAGTGPATFTFQFSDNDGWQDLGVLNILVNDWLDGRNACYIAYSQPYSVLFLVNDAGTALSPPMTLGGAGSVSNSQCTIYSTGSSASGAGAALTLILNMSFSAAFAGNRAFYLAARDAAEHNSGWQALGTWTVP